MTQIFVNRPELLPTGETTQEHKMPMQEEADLVESDKQNTNERQGGLFKGLFNSRMGAGRQPIRDLEDGIDRCPMCAWELEDGVCSSCGYNTSDEYTDSEYPPYSDASDEETLEERAAARGQMRNSVDLHEAMMYHYGVEAASVGTEADYVASEDGDMSLNGNGHSHGRHHGHHHHFMDVTTGRRYRHTGAGGRAHRALSDFTETEPDSEEDEDAGSLDAFVVEDEEHQSSTAFVADDGVHTSSPRSLASTHYDTDEVTAMYGNPITHTRSSSYGSPEVEATFATRSSSVETQPRATTITSNSPMSVLGGWSPMHRSRQSRALSSTSNSAISIPHGWSPLQRSPSTDHATTYVDGGASQEVPIELGSDSDSPVAPRRTRRRQVIQDPESSDEENSGTVTLGRSSPELHSAGRPNNYSVGPETGRPPAIGISSSPLQHANARQGSPASRWAAVHRHSTRSRAQRHNNYSNPTNTAVLQSRLNQRRGAGSTAVHSTRTSQSSPYRSNNSNPIGQPRGNQHSEIPLPRNSEDEAADMLRLQRRERKVEQRRQQAALREAAQSERNARFQAAERQSQISARISTVQPQHHVFREQQENHGRRNTGLTMFGYRVSHGQETPPLRADPYPLFQQPLCDTRACWRCGKVGHVMANCSQQPRCIDCGMLGHVSRDCPDGIRLDE